MVHVSLHSVMVVDDDPTQRELLENDLLERGFTRVWKARNGTEAKAILAEHGSEIDLIVTDLNMPDCDGVEFLMHLSSKGTTAGLIILSGAAGPVLAGAEALASTLNLKFLGLIRKPLVAGRLDDVLSKLEVPEPA